MRVLGIESGEVLHCFHESTSTDLAPQRRRQNGGGLDATNRLSGLYVRMAPWYDYGARSALVSIASPQGAESSRGPDDLLLMRRAGGNRPGLGQQIRYAQDVPGY